MYGRELTLPALSLGEPSFIISRVLLLPSHQGYRQHTAEQSSPSKGNVFTGSVLRWEPWHSSPGHPVLPLCRGSPHPARLKPKKQMLALYTDFPKSSRTTSALSSLRDRLSSAFQDT